MKQLNSALTAYFKPAAKRKPADPTYATFRTYCKARGVTYKVARDGFIEFSDGACFAHYGDWAETQRGHEEFATGS
ncbi:hypothetical protein K0U83_03385 [bacterium]|jgi:hypothetical protein|nr:hypothetical protein [bacterium]